MGNDPVNKIDPTGMAQCGSNLKGEKCEQALNDADQARKDATTVSNGIKGITAKMASGEKLSDADNATVAAIGEKFGDKFTSEKGLNKLAGGLDKAANKIGERGEGAILAAGNNISIPFSGRVAPAYVLGGALSSKIYLNNNYFSYGSTNRQSIMLHESAHMAGAWRDKYIEEGNNPLFNKSSGYSNADTYSCLVYPGSCGF